MVPVGCLIAAVFVIVPMGALIKSPGDGAGRVFRVLLAIIMAVAGVALMALSTDEEGCAVVGGVVGFVVWLVLWILLGKAEPPLPSGAVRSHAVPNELQVVDLPGPPFRARLRYGMRLGDHGDRFLYVEFACPMSEETPRLVIASEEWRGRLRVDAALTALDVGAWPYLVRAGNASFASILLDPPMRALIAKIDQMHAGSFLLDVRPGQMSIRSAARIAEHARMQEFIALCYQLAGRLVPSVGIEVMEVRVSAPEEAMCRVCGCAVTAPVARCASCRTPHHQDCWDYNGGCSVYACGGRNVGG